MGLGFLSNLDRRRFLKYGLLATAGAALAGAATYEALMRPSPSIGSSQSSTSNYSPPPNATPNYADFLKWASSASRPYAGQTLNVSMEYEFSPLALQRIDLDFFNATTLNDQYDLKPYYLHLSDISLMAKTQAPTYDIFNVDHQDVASFKDHIISPTELADRYPDLTYSKLRPGDFRDLAWSRCAVYPPTATTGDILFIPLDMATMIQFYRRDQFKAGNLTPATDWNSYVSNAKSLVNASGVLGTVNEASPNVSIVFEYLNFLRSFGGDFWRINGGNITSALDTDAALDALQTYISLRNYSDPASFTYSWPDVATTLLHGYGGEALQFQDYAAWMDDSLRSSVVNQMDYAPMPSGTAGSFSTYGGSGIGVSKYSKHPEAAWIWLQWATALGTQEMTVLDYFQPFPSRKAVFDNSQVTQALDSDKYRALRVTKNVWDSGQLAALLPFPKWTSIVNPIGYHLSRAWTGDETPQGALASAMSQISSHGALTF